VRAAAESSRIITSVQIRAAILWEQGQPLSVESAELDPPNAGEVLVEVKAAGVCHSDLHAISGDWPMTVPLVPGHEGAGVVRELGEGVTRVKPGDRVVFCWAPACGQCPACRDGRPLLCDRLDRTTFRNRLPTGDTRLRARDREVAPFLGTACFATHAVVPQEALIPIAADVPFESLAAVGCAVITGVGAVTNAARVPAGATVAVIGAGGVGLNVVQGAHLAGSARVIAIDRQAAPLALARTLGATDAVTPGGRISDAVKELTGGRGADFVFDTVGTPDTMADAIASARKGGTVVLTGLSRLDAKGTVKMYGFVMHEKRLIGSVYGSGDPLQDVPRLVELHRSGRLKLGELAARVYPLEGVNEALDALAKGTGGRGILKTA
jgi:S-(hydroxymethyl)glutathione dehydrogenase/alcohol dehydrogenase